MKQRRSKPNPNNIPGVYNYCDAWCERCYFTSRCTNYQMQREMEKGKDIDDLSNEEFWEEIEDNLGNALSMLHDAADEMGIDLNEISDEEMEEIGRERDKIHEEAEDTWIAKVAKKYGDDVHKWIKKNTSLFEEKEKELEKDLLLNISNDQIIGRSFAINDAMEIVMWYHFFIYVKLRRALQGKLDKEQQEWYEEENFPKDSDGSAKIALISMDRSISAWGVIYNHFPEQGDEVLNYLMTLEKLRNAAEKEFPDARKFVRPGFDER
ncbi:MAG: hypothetical protein ABI723_17905 [Bacteroidia bacterium]